MAGKSGGRTTVAMGLNANPAEGAALAALLEQHSEPITAAAEEYLSGDRRSYLVEYLGACGAAYREALHPRLMMEAARAARPGEVVIGKVEEPVAPPANQRVVVLDVKFDRADRNTVPELGETIHVVDVDLLRAYEGMMASGYTRTPHAQAVLDFVDRQSARFTAGSGFVGVLASFDAPEHAGALYTWIFGGLTMREGWQRRVVRAQVARRA